MERTGFKKIKQRLVIYAALAILAYGALAFFYNPVTRAITAREDKPINLLVLTDPPMFISYNPKFRKVMVTNIAPGGKDLKAQDILKAANVEEKGALILSPLDKNRADFWENAKKNLHSWQHRPYITFALFYNYAKARISGRTNITPSDFIMLAGELAVLQAGDFIVKNPAPTPARPAKKTAPPQPVEVMLAQGIKPAPVVQKTLVVEILNASGRNGLASEVTRYLRDLNNRGLIDIDVINSATNPATEEKTRIIDLAHRQQDLKKAARFLGLDNNEIFSASDKNSIADAKIILGRDFNLPKTQNLK